MHIFSWYQKYLTNNNQLNDLRRYMGSRVKKKKLIKKNTKKKIPYYFPFQAVNIHE